MFWFGQLLFANLCLTAYDNALPLPKDESKLVRVHPKGYPWSFNVHLLCTDPPKHGESDGDDDGTATLYNFPSDHRTPRKNHTHVPTIIYEAPSGVPGSIAHLKPARLPYKNNPFPVPRPPNNGTVDESQSSPYPGSWILSLQASHKVGRVCVWDRPGYGFSDSGSTELGQVADALQEALEKTGEKGPFILVGDGYGGLITRVFASRHRKHVHSILHIDAQTAQTYFRFPPRYNLLTLQVDRFFNHLIPTLLSPLGITRFYSLFAYYDSATARILASKRPNPSSTYLSEKMQATLLREMYLSHTHDSPSYKTLLSAQPPKYPADKPAIILSSDEMMQRDKAWAEGQRSLAEEITSEEHRISWEIVKGRTGHDICSPYGGKDGRGRRYCTRALKTLFALD